MKRAMMIPVFCTLLFGLAWLLVACMPIQPNEGTELSELAETAASASASSSACEETVIQGDLTDVSQKPELTNHLVYWTWHMNFLEFDDPLTQRHPLSCFRLYAREQPGGMFQEIDQGGIVISNCEVIGNVTFDIITQTYAVRGNSAPIVSPITAGRANFVNDGYIVCSNFSIILLIEYIKQNAQQYGVTQPISQALSQLSATQVYSSLTMVATGYVSDTELTNPVLSYQPTDDKALADIAAGQMLDPKVEFLLPADPDPAMFTFSALLEERQYVPEAPFQPNCMFDNNEDHFWWMDYWGYNPPEKRLLFHKHKIVDPPPSSLRTDECPIAVGNLPPSTITFWLGKSAIYIGCQWNQGECNWTFNGVLYGVLIDPLDSKPQT